MKIKNYLDKILIAITIVIITIIGFINKKNENNIDNKKILINDSNSDESESKKNIIVDKQKENKIESTIYVHITGCVMKQGVYELKSDSRVKDLVDKAGGFCKDVNIESINLSQKLKDEMKIHVYKIGEEQKKTSNITENNFNDAQNYIATKININIASKEQLMTLPGIGSSRADEIIKYRSENKFQSIDEIKNISGIGEKSFEKIKEKITVD